jgi:hypothetical protein
MRNGVKVKRNSIEHEIENTSNGMAKKRINKRSEKNRITEGKETDRRKFRDREKGIKRRK